MAQLLLIYKGKDIEMVDDEKEKRGERNVNCR